MKLTSATIGLALAGCIWGAAEQIPGLAQQGAPSPAGPHASHVTIVLMENKAYDLIAGSRYAPYFNGVLVRHGVLLRNSHAVAHPSEPNYLALFSGSTQGVHGDPCPVSLLAANIASELSAAGKTFAGYSESMPSDGYTGCHLGLYDRNHNPWVEFTNVPAADNLVYRGLPSRVASLVWITPNLCHDMHSCSVQAGDAWLSKDLPPIIAWDKAHDGLLIVTWDEAEPDKSGTNHIPTVLIGPMVRPGIDDVQDVDHYAVLHTIETILGVPCIDRACHAPLLTGIWRY
jgi:phosphatidylinositol-3-phosphatase